MLKDTAMSGSDGAFGITLRDDGHGNIYRADAEGTHATWSTVGNIFYNEGLVLLKSPQLFFFGTEGYEMSFKGVNNIHVLSVDCYAKSFNLVSSSNTSYSHLLKADEDLKNNQDDRYVYITSINIHDEDMNIIGKSQLAQPILKRSSDSMLFKWKLDF